MGARGARPPAIPKPSRVATGGKPGQADRRASTACPKIVGLGPGDATPATGLATGAKLTAFPGARCRASPYRLIKEGGRRASRRPKCPAGPPEPENARGPEGGGPPSWAARCVP